MNISAKHIGIILLFFFYGINIFSQVDVQEKNFEQLQNTLTNEQQSAYDLTGFEGRAVQKLEDLAGYIEIISNKGYDLTLRKQALSLAGKLFYDDQITIKNSDKQLSSLNILELNEYLNSVLKTGYVKIVVEITNREYVENLKQSKSDLYSGKLIFEQTNTYYKTNDVHDKTTEKKEVDIILIKTEKAFGKKKKSVWNVFLGDIRIVK